MTKYVCLVHVGSVHAFAELIFMKLRLGDLQKFYCCKCLVILIKIMVFLMSDVMTSVILAIDTGHTVRGQDLKLSCMQRKVTVKRI